MIVHCVWAVCTMVSPASCCCEHASGRLLSMPCQSEPRCVGVLQMTRLLLRSSSGWLVVTVAASAVTAAVITAAPTPELTPSQEVCLLQHLVGPEPHRP